MSQCQGDLTLATKVDASMNEFVEDETERLGISRAELHRRLLDFYRESRQNNPPCPHCGEDLDIALQS